MHFTPFDPDKHRSIRDLPRDVALAFVLVFVIILIASLSPAQGAARTQHAFKPDAVQVFAYHEALMAGHHPGLLHYRGYHYDGYDGQGKLVHITGIQVRAWIGKGINDPCWFLATLGHTVTTGSCRGN